MLAADRAGVFQGSEPAVAGGEAETDSLGEFGEGYSSVLLELGKDLSVYGVHVDDPSSATALVSRILEAHSAVFRLFFPARAG